MVGVLDLYFSIFLKANTYLRRFWRLLHNRIFLCGILFAQIFFLALLYTVGMQFIQKHIQVETPFKSIQELLPFDIFILKVFNAKTYIINYLENIYL